MVELTKRGMRLIIISVMPALVLILAVVYFSTYTILEQVMENQLGITAKGAAVGIALTISEDLDGYRGFLASRSVESEYYTHMQEYFGKIKQSNENIRFIYTVNRIDETTTEFILDAEPVGSENYSYPGDPEVENTVTLEAFNTKQPQILEPTESPFGILIGGCAPILDENGEVAGVVGVDVDNSTVFSAIQDLFLVLGALGVFLLCAIGFLLWVVSVYLKRVEDASKVKTQFLANMSHEIRTPMNAIIGMSDLLLYESLNERQTGFVNDINLSAHSLLGIINDILDLSKIEAGKLKLVPADYDFNVFIDNVSSMFIYVAEKKGLRFIYETEGEIPRFLFGDDIRLRQVLTNICGNAVKFTEQGHIKLKVTAQNDEISFAIEDTGMGIRQEDISKLFKAFEQVNTVKARGIVGSGLGLSISKSFVEMMGGRISVKSEYERGTVFTVTIPIVQGDKDKVAYDKNLKKSSGISAPGARVLVVDDNQFNLNVAKGLLGLSKIDPVLVLSGAEAIERVQQEPFDIIFMDHMMPEMDGLEAAREIRNLGDGYQNLPIIALTANAVHGAKEMFLLNGMNGFVSKPIDIQLLNEVLEEWLPKEKVTRQAEDEQQEAEPQPAAGGQLSEFMSVMSGIDKVNTKIGLQRVAGSEDIYRESIEQAFCSLEPECEKMSSFLAEGDTGAFSISVHAMKSVMAQVGAMGLSEMALRLEDASKKGAADYCLENYPLLRNELLALRGQLSAIFPDGKVSVKEAGDSGMLRAKVQEALAAAEDFDSDAALVPIEELLSFDFGDETNRLLEEAAAALRNYSIGEAKGLLEEIEMPAN